MRNEPIVMVHGWGGSFARTWQEPGWEALLMDAGRTVIGVDLLGHGTAPKPHDPEAYADLGARVLEAMPADGQVDAIGFSLGAMTLLDVAVRHPERFSRLIVSGIGNGALQEGRSDSLADAVLHGASDDDVQAQVFEQYAKWPGNDPDALAACLRRTRRPITAEELGALQFPVLVVLGDRDFAWPADELIAALPDAALVTLRGTDHFATPKDMRFIDAALEFLDAIPS